MDERAHGLHDEALWQAGLTYPTFIISLSQQDPNLYIYYYVYIYIYDAFSFLSEKAIDGAWTSTLKAEIQAVC